MKTVEVYQKKAGVYLATTIEHDRLDPSKAKKKRERLQELIKRSFSSLPHNAKVFEIGSGDGANAKYIESLGFKVTASDTAVMNISIMSFLKVNWEKRTTRIFCVLME